jgi:deoxyribodipyrimidine photo-lyase
MRPIIVWFRRDLRSDDHAALRQASLAGAPVIPLFIVDTDLIRRLPSDGAAFTFQQQALQALQGALARLGGMLIIRQGNPYDVHRHLISEVGPAALYFHRDYEPAAIERDARVIKLYEQHDIEVRTFKDGVIQEPTEVLTAAETPYVVFTPYARAWKRLPLPVPPGTPAPFSTPPVPGIAPPGPAELKRTTSIASPFAAGGEPEAMQRWRTFLDGGLKGYATGRDLPGTDGTSRMSAHLRFGCISITRMADDCRRAAETGEDSGAGKFLDELIWRDFYQAVLFHFPHLTTSAFRPELDRLPRTFDAKLFDAWRLGLTGFPLVDAGMRELNSTGWMHNRVRMVTASFLTKDLTIDWRLGEKVFEEKLIDADTASNNGGWQWAASTGVDPRPLRIFNPQLQAKRYDPDGTYIRRFVPELVHVPSRWIHAPHTMPAAEQEKARCVIGRDYPAPIVDHAAAAAAFKEAYAKLKAATG